MESFCTVWKTRLGWMGLVGNEAGIQRIYLPVTKKEEIFDLVQKKFPDSCEKNGLFKKEVEQIQEYFCGTRKEFQIPLDFSETTPFQKRVYEILLTIPFGEVRTYAWVAQAIGNPKALRAVGNANGKNPWPLIVPCHRIVGSNGFLTGFSASGGLELKASLLRHEGIRIQKYKILPPQENDIFLRA